MEITHLSSHARPNDQTIKQWLDGNFEKLSKGDSLEYVTKLHRKDGKSFKLRTITSCYLGVETQLQRIANDYEENEYGELVTKKVFGDDIVKIELVYIGN